jgi:Ca2+-binding EF-hand superfamily protein
MYEPEQRNSGMPAGKFLKRMQHPAISMETLIVNETISVYGRTFKIYECDDFTRQYYAAHGIDQGDDFIAPSDPWGEASALVHRGGEGEHRRKMNSLKRYQESRLGALVYKTDSMARFLEFDKQAVTFFALWEDKRAFGEKHQYKVSYYLSTGEVQITETKNSNAQVTFPLFLKKQRLPRTTLVHDDRSSSCEDGDGSSDYYNENDFNVGEVLKVHGRSFLLYGCDGVTQRWYMQHKGIDQQANTLDVTEPGKKKKELLPPPPTGFGGDEDSLQSWKYLVPKPKKTDFARLKAATGKTLKYQAKMVSRRPTDMGRHFRITWYLDDDTMAVYEPKKRNTGVLGGAMASRGKYKNPSDGEHYKISDLYVGNLIEIAAHLMEITHADEFSLKYMEQEAGTWPMCSLDFVLENLKRMLLTESKSLRKMFRKFDEDKSQTISLQEFQNMLDYYGMPVRPQELLTIFRAFDREGSGMIDYVRFCEVFAENDTIGGAAALHVAMNLDIADGKMTDDEAREYQALAEAKDEETKKRAYIDGLLHRIAIAMRNSKAATVLYQKFREFDQNKDNTVDRKEFRMAMGGASAHGMFNLKSEDIDLMENEFFKSGQENLDYDSFITIVTASVDKNIRS